ncbi:enteropeptidase-like [Amphiura filiformis]|uniref:enteropeptidase-like n=1 Tax=Amphiura filiformis TaxID=82378 RepID=UPI003B217B51
MVSLATLGVVVVLTILRRSYGSEYFETFCDKIFDIGESGDVMYSGDVWYNQHYSSNLTCTVTLQTSADRQILLTWTTFNVEKLNDVFGSCVDRLQIYDGVGTSDVARLKNLNDQCGTFGEYPEIVSTENSLTLRLTTDAEDNSNDFVFAYTSFSTEATCDTDEFRCKNGRCIDEKLADTFDFFDNCGDGSDQEALDEWLGGLFRWGLGIFIAIIVAIAIGGILICVCCGCLCYHLICKRQQSSNQTTVVHAPPPHAPDGMQMQGYSNNGYGQK